jgi:hypothetical protein
VEYPSSLCISYFTKDGSSYSRFGFGSALVPPVPCPSPGCDSAGNDPGSWCRSFYAAFRWYQAWAGRLPATIRQVPSRQSLPRLSAVFSWFPPPVCVLVITYILSLRYITWGLYKKFQNSPRMRLPKPRTTNPKQAIK